MADFGRAGKITVRGTRREIVILRPADRQYLYFKLTVSGDTPVFDFLHNTNPLISARDFSAHPTQTYQWTLGEKTSSDDENGEELITVPAANDDRMYLVGMKFDRALKYTLRVEHRDRNDGVIRLLKDMDFESNNSLDFFRELLEVRIP